MFCPPPSCVCCLIAEPPSPRPWDPPGSMYHLLCHLSFFSAFLLLSSSPSFSSSSSSSLVSVFASMYSSHLSAEVTPFHHHGQSDPPTYTVYTGHFMKSQIVTLHVAHKFTLSTKHPSLDSSVVVQFIWGMSSTLSCFSAIYYSCTVLHFNVVVYVSVVM